MVEKNISRISDCSDVMLEMKDEDDEDLIIDAPQWAPTHTRTPPALTWAPPPPTHQPCHRQGVLQTELWEFPEGKLLWLYVLMCPSTKIQDAEL